MSSAKGVIKGLTWWSRKIAAHYRMLVHDAEQCRLEKLGPLIGLIDFLYPVQRSSFCDFEYGRLIEEIGSGHFASIWTGASAQNPDGMRRFFEMSRPVRECPRFYFTASSRGFKFVDAFYMLWFACLQDCLTRGKGKPFGFTLYPDESWQPDSVRTLDLLGQAFEHRGFTGVICTQKLTLDFIATKFGRMEGLVYKHGVAVALPDPEVSLLAARHRFESAAPVHVLFAARLHTESLRVQKGLYVLLDAARLIKKMGSNIRFSVVGMPVSASPPADLIGTVAYFPPVDPDSYLRIVGSCDVFWSPNSGWRDNGMFDGFPTGAAIQAAAGGCVLLSSDPLGEFPHTGLAGGAVVICGLDPVEFAERTVDMARNRDALFDRQISTIQEFHRIYSASVQLEERVRLIRRILARV